MPLKGCLLALRFVFVRLHSWWRRNGNGGSASTQGDTMEAHHLEYTGFPASPPDAA